MVGALVMAFLNNGLQLLGVGTDWTQMIKGLVLLLAVAFDVLSKKQGKPSIIGLFSATRKRNQASSDTALVPENDSKKESPGQEAKA